MYPASAPCADPFANPPYNAPPVHTQSLAISPSSTNATDDDHKDSLPWLLPVLLSLGISLVLITMGVPLWRRKHRRRPDLVQGHEEHELGELGDDDAGNRQGVGHNAASGGHGDPGNVGGPAIDDDAGNGVAHAIGAFPV